MTWLLDLLAVAAVVAALAFLLRRPKGGCADCGAARRPAEARVALDALRSSARRAARR